MRRVALIGMLTVAVAACDDASQFTDAPDVGPQFAVLDGANGGNDFFFWLPPMVPNPNSSGTFDPLVQPSVEICKLIEDPDNPGEYVCEGGRANLLVRYEPGPAPDGVHVDAGSHYHIDFDLSEFRTGPDRLRSDDKLRIYALVGTTQGTSPDVLAEFGFRDIEVNGAGRRNDPFYGVGITSTLPIKFEVFEGALCFDTGEDNCATTTITTQAGNLTSGDGLAAIYFQDFTVPEGGNVTVQYTRLNSDDGRCVGFGTPTGDPNSYPTQLDLPFFPECWLLKKFPADAEFDALLEFNFCVAHEGRLINDAVQSSRIHLYRAEDNGTGVQVLDQVFAQIDCTNVPTFFGRGESNPLIEFARRLVDGIAEPFLPTPLIASNAVRHHGTAGIGPSSVVGTYLPASLQPDPLAGWMPGDIVDLGIVFPGAELDVVVKALDKSGDAAMNGRVNWAVSDGAEFVGTPDAMTFGFGDWPDDEIDPVDDPNNGLAIARVRFNDKGTQTVTASGVGYATPPLTGVNGVDGRENVSSTPFSIVFQAVVDNTLVGAWTNTPNAPRGAQAPDFTALVTVGDGVTPVKGATVTITGISTNNGTPERLQCFSLIAAEPEHDAIAEGRDCITVTTDANGIATFDDLSFTKSGVLNITAIATKDGFDDSAGFAARFHVKPK